MMILVSGSTRATRDVAAKYAGHVGHLTTPANANGPASLAATGLPWAADNGCYGGLDAGKFRRLLARVRGLPRCLFVVVPDVVGDAKGTLALWHLWREEVATCGQPLAFVGQDGAEALRLPWDEFDAYFVGGSTAWKLGVASAGLVAGAKRRGKWVHLGRCNSMRRLRLAFGWGCHSVDGSSYSRWAHRARTHRPDMGLERHLRFLVSLEKQKVFNYSDD